MSSLISALTLVEIGPNARIVLEAIDPVTGSPVGGVTVSDVAISTDQPNGPPEEIPVLPPLLAHEPVNPRLEGDLPG